ncbi:MAG: PIG-L family deacetylase [Microthrixaceae bacterium]
MSTLVCFHAHPDDECIATAGLLVGAKAAGHRTVLVVATRGERGEVAEGVLEEGEALWERRTLETYESARILGVDRLEFLGYVDSGMMGEPTNDAPYCFWQADVEAAAERLAAVLREESADLLTVYDDHGGYGHPDHIQVHRVGIRAAELAGVPRVLQATMNRDAIREAMAEALAAAEEAVANEADAVELPDVPDDAEFGKPAAEITHGVDVAAHLEEKRAAMVAHASQIPPDSWFLRMAPEDFARAFGTEWYIEWGRPRGADEPFRSEVWR